MRRPQNFACEIFTLLLPVCTVVKSEVKISQNFVAFSDYMKFKNEWTFKQYTNFHPCFFPFLDSGANVILTTGGIDDLCLKYFVEAGAMAVRRCKKVDLKRYNYYLFVQFFQSF